MKDKNLNIILPPNGNKNTVVLAAGSLRAKQNIVAPNGGFEITISSRRFLFEKQMVELYAALAKLPAGHPDMPPFAPMT